MGTAYLCGGGVLSLNYSIIQAPSVVALPATARENAIAIITDTPISEYRLWGAVPTWAAQEGEVCIVCTMATNLSSPAFNALKKNGIGICPFAVYQYKGNVWTIKSSYIFQTGVWRPVQAYIWLGGTNPNLGGWAQSGSGSYAETSAKISFYGVVGVNAFGQTFFSPNNQIDLTPFKTCILNYVDTYTNGTAAERRIHAGFSKSKFGHDAAQYNTVTPTSPATWTATLNIESLSGLYYFTVRSYDYGTNGASRTTAMQFESIMLQ